MVKTLVGPEFTDSVSEKNVGLFFFNSAGKFGDRICQIDGTNDTYEKYASVKLRSIRAAIAMKKRKLTSADIICVCSANTLDNTIPMIAAFYLGVKVANLDVTASVRTTKHLLTLVTPKIIFVEESSVKLIEDSLIEKNFVTEIIVFGSYGRYRGFSEFLKPQKDELEFQPDDDIEPDDLALIVFSSGSTGPEKAICHTHRSFIVMILQGYQYIIRENIFHTLSFYIISSLILLGCAFKAGTFRLFYHHPTAENVLALTEKYKVAYMFTSPYFTYELTRYENINKHDISSLQMIMTSGTPLPASHINKIRNLFPKTVFSFVYGMSEMGMAAAFHPKDDQRLVKKKVKSVGRPCPGVMLKVVQVGGNAHLAHNQHGEICLRASSMMTGYLNQDSSAVFDAEGYLKTGDIGYFDRDQWIYVTQRTKEVFMYQSCHIIPSTIEEVLLEHPAITDAAVFGVPGTDQDGELPAAFIILKEGCELTEKDIDTYLKEQVADNERLRGGVTFVDTLPVTRTGQINRAEIRHSIINKHK